MAQRQNTIPLNFPLHGLTENTPFSRRPEGTTLRALNVVPFDTTDDRMRGGKRPGTSRAIREPVAEAGKPVQRLGQVTLAATFFIEPQDFFTDPAWDSPSWGWPEPEIIYPDDPALIANPDLLEAGTLTVL